MRPLSARDPEWRLVACMRPDPLAGSCNQRFDPFSFVFLKGTATQTMESTPKIGKTLRDARKSAQLTQEALADKAGVHRTYVSLLERDKKSPTLKVVFQLCHALNKRPSELISEYEDEVQDNDAWW